MKNKLTYVLIMLIVIAIILGYLVMESFMKKRDTVQANAAYLNIVQKMTNEVNITANTPYFDITYTYETTAEGYIYKATIHDAKVAMFKVEAVLLNTAEIESTAQMDTRTFGVNEDEGYAFVPHQSDIALGFYDKYDLYFTSPSSSVETYLYVTWRNELGDITFETFIKHTINTQEVTSYYEAR